MRSSKDIWQGLTALVLSGIAAVLAHNLSTGGADTNLGPAFSPRLMGICSFFFGSLLVVRSFMRKLKIQEAASKRINLKLFCNLSIFLR